MVGQVTRSKTALERRQRTSICRKLGENEHSQHEHTHFHPSGDPTPSEEDIETTKQLVAAGRVLDIGLVDHLIIGHQRFISLKEHLRWE